MRNIPFFDYPSVFASEEDKLIDIIRGVGRRGAFIAQEELEGFERRLADYVGARYAIGVGNGTDGLELALRAGGIQPGDEVILCSHTMLATAVAVHFAGGIPVPVDAGADHLMDPEKAEAAVGPKTRAIFPTQLNGRTADMDAIREIADRHGLLVFEDAAQALGSKFKGRFAGTFGVASAISFYPAKLLGCLGDGGAVLTNDAQVYDKLLMLRDLGRRADGRVGMWGRNTRLDNIQAAILDHRLSGYGQVVKRRRDVARRYRERLEGIEEITLPPGPDNDPDHFDVYQNYEIEAQRRDELKKYLEEKGIGTLIQWGGVPIHRYRQLGFTRSLPDTDRLFERLLMLPMNMTVSDDEVDYICDCIAGFYET